MSEFKPAIELVLHHEGGYVDDSADPGGATNYGISLRYLQKAGATDESGYLVGDLDKDGDIDADDIRLLDRAAAIEIYRSQFWDRYRYSQIENQAIANRVFSLAVNAGPARAAKVLQTALNYHAAPLLKIDGIAGDRTFEAVNRVDPDWLLTEFRHEWAAFYRSVLERNGKLLKFRKGWMHRAYH